MKYNVRKAEKMKKKSLSVLIISLAIITTTYIFFKGKESKEIESTEIASENLSGASEDNPDDLSGSYPKYGKMWDFHALERYYFSGSGRQVYTNYEFAENVEYDVTVENTSSNPIEILVLTGIYTILEKVTIPGDTSETFTVSGMEKDEEIYLGFQGSGGSFSVSFLGYIEYSKEK